MSFDPNKISQKHVLDAVARIEKEGLKLIDSTKYDVIINGRKYPPKEIMRLARFEYDGDDFWKYGGGLRAFPFRSTNACVDLPLAIISFSLLTTYIKDKRILIKDNKFTSILKSSPNLEGFRKSQEQCKTGKKYPFFSISLYGKPKSSRSCTRAISNHVK